MNVRRPGTPGSNEILATVNVATEDVYVILWVRLWDAYKRHQTIPRSDPSVEVIILPGLAMTGEGLSERNQHKVQGSKNAERTSPVITIS